MTDYMRKHMGHECPPRPEYPADQPKPPGPADGSGCNEYEPTKPPTVAPPKPCPPPDSDCKCPDPPGSGTTCLEDLIAEQTVDTALLQQENLLTQELNKLLETAKKASQAYTPDKYDDLVERWRKADVEIAELIRKLVCAVPCWKCILDCYVCPLLNDLHQKQKWLYDDDKLITTANDLYDLQYWHTRDRGWKARRLARIKEVLKAWETPALTIDKVLNDNKALIESLGPFIGPQPGKAIYAVFLVLIPRHLAIAPPATSLELTTTIDKKYTEFCPCDGGTPDNCCGPDVGELSFRQRLIGPLPYLIKPNAYFDLICCLVRKRYTPATLELGKADADLAAVNAQIARYEKAIGEGWKPDFEKNAEAIPKDINCCDYEKYDDDGKQQRYTR
ncbi:MAG TPA: hypothetical protein VJM50_00645 [Pyrinomonadaceae bacterium]|nr:hypothetical protein [Pyrinomonadaceae bacterium]